MSNAPDFSSTFDLVDDALADAEKRLQAKRMAAQTAKAEPAKKARPEPVKTDQAQSSETRAKHDVQVRAEPEPVKPKQQKKKPRKEEGRPELQLVSKEHRRNLTLKVLEENERKFNELFYKLQLQGDSRKKQDLADEALTLLYDKYSAVLN